VFIIYSSVGQRTKVFWLFDLLFIVVFVVFMQKIGEQEIRREMGERRKKDERYKIENIFFQYHFVFFFSCISINLTGRTQQKGERQSGRVMCREQWSYGSCFGG